MSKTIIIAETALCDSGVQEFLDHLGVPDWDTDSTNDAEQLIEIAGRLCYKSFSTELNPNLTRIREGNAPYLANVMSQKHGSVFEHASTSVMFLDVSRILTHELVRHRPIAISQESQRFVRLDTYSIYIPDLTNTLEQLYEYLHPEETKQNRDEWVQEAQAQFVADADWINSAVQLRLSGLISEWGLESKNNGVSFHIKKKLTSALRRLVPGGVNTNILVSANHRMWRHMIENRSSPGAEQEIVEVFGDVATQFARRYPHIYQDMIEYRSPEDDLNHYRFENQKI